MRHSGSVLVVVLGLLAILAVVGVAFVTMSTLDRTTAASFALQTQMMLSADGAIEFVSHEMVLDVWEWYTDPTTTPRNIFYFTGKLLTGRKAGTDPATNPNWNYAACESYDYPSAAVDAWLSSPITSQKTPTRMSFQEETTKVFGGLLAQGTARTKPGNWPENLGLPVADPTSDLAPTASSAWTNGIWIPNLIAPFNQYLVRTSVTVLDHNALVNLNAHGNQDTGGMWVYDDCRGNGYFISDVNPTQLGGSLDLNALLVGDGSAPGCWGTDKSPRDFLAGAVVIENPGTAGQDVPFTLDEEFELRRLWGTHFKSRLERFWPTLDTTPDNYPKASLDSACASRLKATTVSWTAEVRGDNPDVNINHATASALGSAWTDQAWSCPKPDLNTSSAVAIYEALCDSNAWADGDELKQIVANIVAFRNRSNDFDADYGGKVGAERQPFFSEVTVEGSDTRTIKVELFNPWPGDAYGDTTGLTVAGMTVVFGTTTLPALTGKIGDKQCYSPTFTHTVTVPSGTPLTDQLSSIQLKKGAIVLDEITKADIAKLDGASRLYRPIAWENEARGSVSNAILKVYIGDWKEGGTANFGTVNPEMPPNPIPIRFPNCVSSDNAPGLAPRPATAGGDFKAFARLGDLNQVLRGSGANFWPWVVTVAKLTSLTSEPTVKFDWMKDIGNLGSGGTAAAYAANVLSAGGPWVDKLDNDGDGKTDDADKGISNDTEAGAPEFRVAGKINLNTATDETLNALGAGVGVAGLKNAVRTLRGDQGTGGEVKPTVPIQSPAQILQVLTGTGAGVEGRDEPFTRISNIATVRSDTFSIYGTVQVVDPASKITTGTTAGSIPDSGIIRSRRFWALVDRSPALTFRPEDSRYIRPRILNFQWLD